MGKAFECAKGPPKAYMGVPRLTITNNNWVLMTWMDWAMVTALEFLTFCFEMTEAIA